MRRFTRESWWPLKSTAKGKGIVLLNLAGSARSLSLYLFAQRTALYPAIQSPSCSVHARQRERQAGCAHGRDKDVRIAHLASLTASHAATCRRHCQQIISRARRGVRITSGSLSSQLRKQVTEAAIPAPVRMLCNVRFPQRLRSCSLAIVNQSGSASLRPPGFTAGTPHSSSFGSASLIAAGTGARAQIASACHVPSAALCSPKTRVDSPSSRLRLTISRAWRMITLLVHPIPRAVSSRKMARP
ncbi:hypothetical protein ACVWZL_009098 [Bradyrhizobium sp. GM2.4]